jgi:hypothetical protein
LHLNASTRDAYAKREKAKKRFHESALVTCAKVLTGKIIDLDH